MNGSAKDWVTFNGDDLPVIKATTGNVEMEHRENGLIKMSVTFNGKDGEITHSKNVQGVLKTGFGCYTINPTDEERYNQYRKEHPTKWDKFKRWLKKAKPINDSNDWIKVGFLK